MLKTWQTEHFKLSRLETSRFQMSRLSAVASGLCVICDVHFGCAHPYPLFLYAQLSLITSCCCIEFMTLAFG